jgi:phage repressor protein C with HTH and peptisase S24 domain
MHVINAIGDSMEPSIYEGNKILVDTNYRKLNKQNIFIISTTEGVFIKRIQLNGNNLILISDNQEYEDIVININDSNFQVIGKVVGII